MRFPCNETAMSDGFEKQILAPTVIKQVIPNVDDDDYHDPATQCVPVLARPVQGLSVNQLFTLRVGTVPADRICHRKPTSVPYSSVFVVDLSCVRCIDDRQWRLGPWR